MKKIALVLTCLLLSACSNPAPSSTESQLRIIAAAAGSLQILQEIGLGQAVVAVDERNQSDNSELTLISTGHSLNLEAILTLQPTHIIVDSLVGSESALQSLQSNNVVVITVPLSESISDISKKYQLLGQQFDLIAISEQAITNFEAKIKSIEQSGQSFRIAFLYLRGNNAIYLVGGKGSGADSLINAVGSVDVGAQLLNQPFTPLSAEIMLDLNPQVLLLMSSGYESVGGLPGLKKLPGLSKVEAVVKNQIITVDDRELLDFGPQTIAVLELLKDKLQEFNVKTV